MADNIIKNNRTRNATRLTPCPRCGILRWKEPCRINQLCGACATTDSTRRGTDCPLYKHGGSKERGAPDSMYSIWLNMRQRCLTPTLKHYHHYGGREISICDRWINSFENFNTDMGPRPFGMELDRIDNNLGYSPENCHWTDRRTQLNNRRNTIRLTFNNETRLLTEWAAIAGLSPGTLWSRVFQRRWPLEKAFNKLARRYPERRVSLTSGRSPKPGSDERYSPADIAQIYTEQNGRCVGCQSHMQTSGRDKYHIDHIIPLQPRNGGIPGSNRPDNIQLLCKHCNSSKNNMSMEEWLSRRTSTSS